MSIVDNRLYSGEYIWSIPDYQQQFVIALRELTQAWLRDESKFPAARLYLAQKYTTDTTVGWLFDVASRQERWGVEYGLLNELCRLINLRLLCKHQLEWYQKQQSLQDCKTKKGLRNWKYLEDQKTLIFKNHEALDKQFQAKLKVVEALHAASVPIIEKASPNVPASTGIDWDKEILLEEEY